MKVDNVGQCVYSDTEAFNLIMQGIDIDSIYIENSSRLNETLKYYECNDFNHYIPIDAKDEESFHRLNQSLWKMPNEYLELDIADYLRGITSLYSNSEYLDRLEFELEKFEEYNLMDILRYMKYMVEVFEKKNVIWGIGRGSSVASLCLYLLGVHSVDPVMYDIKFDEFLE
jgi:DNA polymerase III alpha subunit